MVPYLIWQPFTFVTDQQSLAYIFDSVKRTKNKNREIEMWQAELSSFGYSILYKPGVENRIPNALSRIYGATISVGTLKVIHTFLGHPLLQD